MVFGYQKEDVGSTSKWWFDRIHPEDSIKMSVRLYSFIEQKTEKWQDEYRFQCADGSYKYVFDRGFLVKDPNGKSIRMIGAIQDVTKQKEEEQRLLLLETVITQSIDAVMITDIDTSVNEIPNIIFVNSAFTNMTGYSAKDVIGKSPTMFFGKKSDIFEYNKLKNAIQENKECFVETIFYKKNDEEFWVNFSMIPVTNKDGEHSHWISIQRNITDDKLKESGLFQFPTVIGGVVPVINIKGIEPGQMKLTGTVIADIFLGKITKWDDSAIKTLNPALVLPNQDITVVRRADGSGTTFIWTNYLSKVSKEFKDTIGEGTAVNWKVGAGGKGNEGVAQMVRQLPGSFGYVEFAYVKQTKMNWVQVQNAAGTWVAPTEDTFKAAAANADWNKTYYQILTNQAGKEAWPISGATFILVYASPAKPADAKASLAFFDWAFTNGDKAADELDYVALPAAVKAKIRADWKRLGLF